MLIDLKTKNVFYIDFSSVALLFYFTATFLLLTDYSVSMSLKSAFNGLLQYLAMGSFSFFIKK